MEDFTNLSLIFPSDKFQASLFVEIKENKKLK